MSTVAIIGSEDEYLQTAISKLKDKFPDLNVIESRNGFASEEERRNYLDQIAEINPDIVIVGMGHLYKITFDRFKETGVERARLYLWWIYSSNCKQRDYLLPKVF
ncbi:hypothetical protein DMH27_09785 [Raoultella planticola]|nr:hypothetical protein [Raoultella planticola]